MQLDDIDETILWELARDADQSNRALAARVGVSESTVLNRIRNLRSTGALGRAHADLNFEALGFPIQAIVFVRVHQRARPNLTELAGEVADLAQAVNVFSIGGADDLLVHVFATSTDQLRDFVTHRLAAHPAIMSTNTHIVFDHIASVNRLDHLSGFDEIRRPIARPGSTSGKQAGARVAKSPLEPG